MSKPWGNIGAWAADAELAEAEEKEQASAVAQRDAVVTTKGKKKTKMTLQEFNMQSTPSSALGSVFESKGLTPDEMFRLPTGPKERSADEMQHGRLGGGFSSSGGGRSGGPPRGRDGDGDGSWGGNRRSYGGGLDDDRRGPASRVSDFDQPSRADEVDNWAMTKKPMGSSFDSGPGPNRYASLGTGGGNEGFSRADETDNWATGKKQQVSVAPPPRLSSNFGSGFRDSSGPGSGPDQWTRGGGLTDDRERPGPGPDRWTRGGGFTDDRERPRLVLDKPRSDGVVNETAVVNKSNKPNPFGAARPREDILAEKGVDWKKADLEIEAKKSTSRPTSSHSSRPESAQSGRSEDPAALQQGVARPKVNPFGDAKPREVLLEEKGLDWRKIDLDLERHRVHRSETEAEKNLREELEHLRRELEKESVPNADSESVQVSGEEHTRLHDIISHKEKDLEQLIRELDDKVRFGQKAMERPGSGAGRVAAFPERTHSRSGSFEESRSIEFTDRPRSRGTGDARAMQGDDRRGFQGGRERGFLGNRDIDRSRERW